MFKEDAKVDVGSIIASSLNLKDGDFLNDQYIFEKDGFAGTVSNEGAINAFEGGAVALIAPQVLNEGHISADGGSVAMLAGEKGNLKPSMATSSYNILLIGERLIHLYRTRRQSRRRGCDYSIC